MLSWYSMGNKKENQMEDWQLWSIKKDFFFDMEEETSKSSPSEEKISECIFSSDSLSGYGLDLVFDLVKEAGFDGLDLAIWKNFDARKVDYVKKTFWNIQASCESYPNIWQSQRQRNK